jgi:5-methylthioadenosine/S-adenosylhomocysteine deaminase
MTEKTADLRIDAGWIVPVEPDDTVLNGHSLLVKDGRIVALLPSGEADNWVSRERVHLPGHVLIPGLVNLHTHAAMTLLRGFADDLPLMTWLQQHIWPAENRHASPAFVRDGTRLACLEMLQSGVTCFNDMYFFSEAVAEVAVEAGMRVAAGLIVVDAPTPYAGDADDYLQKGLALRDAWSGDAVSTRSSTSAWRRMRPTPSATARWRRWRPMRRSLICRSTCTSMKPSMKSSTASKNTACVRSPGWMRWAC